MGERVCDYRLPVIGKAFGSVAKTEKEKALMSQNRFPAGWDEARVRLAISAYENQTEDEAVAEDEAGVAPAETLIRVPHELLPQVRELIARRAAKQH